MATVTARGITWTTTAGAKSVASFSPAANDLLVAIVGIATSDTAPTMSDSLGGAWTLVGSFQSQAATGGLRMYVRNTAVSGAAMTVTMTPTADAGGGLAVLSISPVSVYGSSAVRSSGGQADQTAATTPAPVLSATPGPLNAIVTAIMDNTNGSANAAPRSGYAEHYDQGFNTPASGIEVSSLGSGETSATLTFSGTTPSIFAAVAGEFIVTLTVSPGLISSTMATFTPTVSQIVTVSPGLISSTMQVFAPSVAPSLSPPLVSTTMAVYAPSVATSGVYAPLVSTTSQVFTPAVSRNVSPGLVSTASQVFTPSVGPSLGVPLISTTSQVYAPAVSTQVSPGLNSTTMGVFSPVLSFQVSPGLVSSSMAVFTPTVTLPAAGLTLDVPLISQISTVYDPTLTVNTILGVPLVTSGLVAYEPAVLVEVVLPPMYDPSHRASRDRGRRTLSRRSM